MIRKIAFQIHWALGITAGLVLVVISLTGVMMAFEDEIMRVSSPGIVTIVPPAGSARLAPDAILARVLEQQPGRRIASLMLPMGAGESARVVFQRDPKAGDEERRSYVDPYDGRLLGPATGEPFFRTVRDLHRWLLLPGNGNGIGRQITGIATLALIYFALSGLWLRWPRRPLDWRQWFVIDLTRRGRSLYRSLHVVIGSWVVVFYLASGLTGLWWSYDWYKTGVTRMLTGGSAGKMEGAQTDPDKTKNGVAGKNGLAGKDTSPGKNGLAAIPALRPDAFAMAMSTVLHESGASIRTMTFTVPQGDKPIRVRALRSDARFDQAYDEYLVEPESGRILKVATYADKTIGQSMTGAWLALHEGAYFGLPGRIVIALSTATLPLFAVTGWLLYLDRRKKRRVKARRSLEVAADAARPMG